MIYTVILTEAGEPDTPLTAWEDNDGFERPVLNSLFEYKDRLYRVYKCLPANDPPNSNVQYYVTLENPDTPYKEGLIQPSYYNSSESQKMMDI